MTNMTRTVHRIAQMLETQGAVVQKTKSGYRFLSRVNDEVWIAHLSPRPGNYLPRAKREVARLGYQWTL